MTRARSVRAAWATALAAALVAVSAAPAAAQKKPKPAATPAPAPPAGEAPPEPAPPEEAPPDERTMEGIDENPGAPKAETTEVAEPAAPPPVVRSGYPIEEVLRPLTLPETMFEIGLDLRVTTFPLFGGTLRARYGITREAQVGLRYGIGAAFDPDEDGPEGTSFETGKAISIDLAYQIQPWVAATLSVPMYLDPFAIGLVLGAPVKFRFGDKLALFALNDFIEIKLDGFVPSVTQEELNVANAAFLDNNTVTSDGLLRFGGGAIVQLKPELALIGALATELPNFESQDLSYPLDVTLQYSVSDKVDLAGRVGFDNLDQADDTFGVRLSARLRIDREGDQGAAAGGTGAGVGSGIRPATSKRRTPTS